MSAYFMNLKKANEALKVEKRHSEKSFVKLGEDCQMSDDSRQILKRMEKMPHLWHLFTTYPIFIYGVSISAELSAARLKILV